MIINGIQLPVVMTGLWLSFLLQQVVYSASFKFRLKIVEVMT